VNGMQDCSDDVLAYVSHATQERLRDVIEKLTEISRHRVEVLKASLYPILRLNLFILLNTVKPS